MGVGSSHEGTIRATQLKIILRLVEADPKVPDDIE